MIKELTKNTYKKELQDAKNPVILELFAPWCGVCQQMEPIFEEIEKEHGDSFLFFKANVDTYPEIAKEYSISSIPAFLFIKDGNVKDKHIGHYAKEDFVEKIKSVFR